MFAYRKAFAQLRFQDFYSAFWGFGYANEIACGINFTVKEVIIESVAAREVFADPGNEAVKTYSHRSMK